MIFLNSADELRTQASVPCKLNNVREQSAPEMGLRVVNKLLKLILFEKLR